MSRLIPRKNVPPLSVPTVTGEVWTLSEQTPENFVLVVFFRGLHCPICRGYISELDKLGGEFLNHGVVPIAISSDSEERARKVMEEWKLKQIDIGYNLSLDTARAWGLYISSGIGKTSVGIEEPEQFSEPGMFLVRPDGSLYWALAQTMPFARPHISELLKAIEFVIKMDYPARGEVE